MKKRIIALVLSLSMIFSLTVSAYAETDTNTTLTACEECGGTESHKEACSKYVEQIEKCEECGETESHKDTCSKYVEPVKKCEECGEKEGHTENCSYSVRGAQTCEKCGQEKCTCNKQSSDVETEVPVVNSAIKEEVTPAEPAALEETDITANIYVENEGIYEEISEHSKDRPLDMKEYNGKTVYVLSSDAEQNIYFKSKSFTGIVGSLFWLNSKECATLTSGENVALGAQSATVTLKAAVPAETEVVLYAKKFLTEDYTVTIKVLDKLPEKEPDTEKPEPSTEVIVGENTFTSDVPMTVSVTAKEKQDLIENALEFSDEKEYYYFDIHAEESTEITVDGLVDKEKAERAILTVHHLLDGADSIANAISSGLGTDYFITEDAVQFAEEVAAGKEYSRTDENRVYYTYQGAEVDNEGNVNFTAYSFSTYALAVEYDYQGLKTCLSDKVSLSYLIQELGLKFTIENVGSVTITTVRSGYKDKTNTIEKDSNGDWTLVSYSKDGWSDKWLNITLEDETVTKIAISNPVRYYYLGEDTDWNMTTSRKNIVPNGTGVTLADTVWNQTAIEKDVIKSAGEIIVYLRPGMAWGVASGTTWPDGSWNENNYGKYTVDDTWEWIWDGNINYALAKKVTEVKKSTFNLRVSDVTVPVTLYVIPENLAPTKVKDTLNADSKYSIASIPVTLYNYDGDLFNQTQKAQTNNYYLGFKNNSLGKSALATVTALPWSGSNLPNSGSISTGIMNAELGKDGLPKMNSTAQTDLFSKTEFSGKEVYENVDFEFIYDKTNGYYTYSSNLNHAQFNKFNNTIELYNETLSPYFGKGVQNSKAGFYPFADINKAFFNLDSSGHKSWNTEVNKDFFQQEAMLAKDTVTTASTDPESTVDMHFGLQMSVDFYMPSGRQADINKNEEDLIYSFTGDDDLWVFIDDQLVLDIGGAHTAVSGTINFTQQKVTVGNYAKVTANGNIWTKGETGSDKTWTFADLGISDIAEDQMHTMRVFYLERWSGESNCRMHFNLPLIPANSVTVSKEVLNQEEEKLSVTPDVDYYFKLYKATDDNSNDEADATNFEVMKNSEYKLQEDSTTVYHTDSEGVFKLKAGETAVFSNISRFSEVYVAELNPYTELQKIANDQYRPDDLKNEDDIYDYKKCVIKTKAEEDVTYTSEGYKQDAEFKSQTKVMPENESIIYTFTNYMQTQPLTIEKTVAGGTDGLSDPEQKFTFNLDFTKNIIEKGRDEIKTADDTPLTDGGSFELAHGESITIPRVPVNMTYTLSENNPDTANDSFDNPNFKLEVGTKKVKEQILEFAKNFENKISEDSTKQKNENKITVQNLQRFDLKITKRISGEETTDQSFRFTVKCEDNHNKATDLEVVIPASAFKADTDTSEKDAAASAVIPNVPVGKYTVSEDTTWSWRYSLDDSSSKDVTVGPTEIGLPEHVVEFKNNRSNIYWLDGNSWCQNIFKDGNIVKTQTTDNPEKPTVDN